MNADWMKTFAIIPSNDQKCVCGVGSVKTPLQAWPGLPEVSTSVVRSGGQVSFDYCLFLSVDQFCSTPLPTEDGYISMRATISCEFH